MEERCNSDLKLIAQTGASWMHVHALTLVHFKQEALNIHVHEKVTRSDC